MGNNKCKGCGAEIRWVTMATSGAKMPLDEHPEPRIVLLRDLPAGVTSKYDNTDAAVMIKVFTQHWATCPKANKFKNGG